MSNSDKSIAILAKSVNLTEKDINKIEKVQKVKQINWILIGVFESFVMCFSALLGYLSNGPELLIEYIPVNVSVYPFSALFIGSNLLSFTDPKRKRLILVIVLLTVATTLFSLLGFSVGYQLNGGVIESTISYPEWYDTTRYGVYTKE
ncbi:MAG: hypothetical protein ACXAC2_17500 [Candidatus Kariarchaeaceae archaeon]|jgi:hypothetical protein